MFIKSYLQSRYFYVKEEEEVSPLCPVNAGVPQGSVLGPTLYLLYTHDLPQSQDVVIGTFADDTAALSVHTNPSEASRVLQKCVNEISQWLKEWKIKANESKSVHVTFTYNQSTCPPIKLNDEEVPQQTEVKYLGIYLDRKLNWKKHIQAKRKALDIQLSKMNTLLHSQTISMENKLLLYKCVIKPIWTYGIQLWGTAANSNIEILQRFLSKSLRRIANAPLYITNRQLHKDLNIRTVKEEIKNQITSYKSRIDMHPNILAANLMSDRQTFVRIKRRAPQDLLC